MMNHKRPLIPLLLFSFILLLAWNWGIPKTTVAITSPPLPGDVTPTSLGVFIDFVPLLVVARYQFSTGRENRFLEVDLLPSAQAFTFKVDVLEENPFPDSKPPGNMNLIFVRFTTLNITSQFTGLLIYFYKAVDLLSPNDNVDIVIFNREKGWENSSSLDANNIVSTQINQDLVDSNGEINAAVVGSPVFQQQKQSSSGRKVSIPPFTTFSVAVVFAVFLGLA